MLKQLLTEINLKLDLVIKNKNVSYHPYPSSPKSKINELEALTSIYDESEKAIKYFETELQVWEERLEKCSSVRANL